MFKGSLIFQVAPSGGKTTLAKQNSMFADIDKFADEAWGPYDKEARLKALESPSLRASLRKVIDPWLEKGSRVLLIHYPPEPFFGVEPDACFYYPADQYIQHVRDSNREDLLRLFDESTLVNWMRDYERLEAMASSMPTLFFQLSHGEYIGDVVADVMYSHFNFVR